MTSFSTHSSRSASADQNERPLAAVIVNPRARRAGSSAWRDVVTQSIETRFAVEVHVSTSAGDVTECAAEYARRGAALVVAAGGDGTVNRVVRGLAATDTALGIIPLGTANDLARELGISTDIATAARRLVHATPRRIDLVEANGIPFVTVGGLTLVSQSAMLVNRLKTRQLVRGAANVLGSAIYRLAATAKLLGGQRIRTRLAIEYEDERGAARTLDVDAHALFVANHRTLGGGLRLPLDTSASDGLMELAWVPARSRPSLTLNFARLSAGKPLPAGVLEVVRARRARVRTQDEDAFVADGELLDTGHDFEIVVRSRALWIAF